MAALHPLDLAGTNGFSDDVGSGARFCWRWFENYRAVTIEDSGLYSSDSANWTRRGSVRPRDLAGTNNYRDEIGYTRFCWRWFEKNDTRYRVVTIEDVNEYHDGNSNYKPLDFDGTNGYQTEIGGLLFCWRWLHREGVKYRVLTLEVPAGPPVVPRVLPGDLAAINDYHTTIPNNARFCWRWFHVRNGNEYRVVTLEDGPDNSPVPGLRSIRPLDLKGVNGYSEGLTNTAFSWRQFNKNGVNYRFLTIEDNGYAPHNGSGVITPAYLVGVNGYSENIQSKLFCWRWVDRGSECYRVVTLED